MIIKAESTDEISEDGENLYENGKRRERERERMMFNSRSSEMMWRDLQTAILSNIEIKSCDT